MMSAYDPATLIQEQAKTVGSGSRCSPLEEALRDLQKIAGQAEELSARVCEKLAPITREPGPAPGHGGREHEQHSPVVSELEKLADSLRGSLGLIEATLSAVEL